MTTITRTPFAPSEVTQRLVSAERRLHDVVHLNRGDLAGADAAEHLRLLQEFFFHVVGATELLAHLVNQERALHIPPENIVVGTVAKALPSSDRICPQLAALYTATRGKPVPSDPYTDESYIFRMLNYRNQVAHYHRNPLLFAMHAFVIQPSLPRILYTPGVAYAIQRLLPSPMINVWRHPVRAFLLIDPCDLNRGAAKKTAQEELRYILQLVQLHCECIISLL